MYLPRLAVTIALLTIVSCPTASADSTDPNGHGAGPSPAGSLFPRSVKGAMVPDETSGPLFQFSATSDEKTASLSTTFNLPTPKQFDIFDTKGAQAQYLTITGQTPVGQGDNYTNVATLDGLTKATSIAFQYSYLDGGFQPNSGGPAYLSSAAQDQCRRLVAEAHGTVPSNHTYCEDADVTRSIEGLKNENTKLQTSIDTASGDEKRTLQQKLDDNNAILSDVQKKQDGLNTETSAKPAPIWMLSINGKVGYDQHVWYDPNSLAKSTSDATPLQFGGELSYIANVGDDTGGSFSLNASFNYQRALTDNGTAQTKCKVTVFPAISCVTGFIGAPKRTDKELIGGDIRYVDTLPVLKIPFGIDPGFTYDGKARSEAVQVPIYLMTNSSHQLTGGIRYDWTSTKHQSIVGIFVTAAFGVFPNLPGGGSSKSGS